jgi:hypothetical protein
MAQRNDGGLWRRMARGINGVNGALGAAANGHAYLKWHLRCGVKIWRQS